MFFQRVSCYLLIVTCCLMLLQIICQTIFHRGKVCFLQISVSSGINWKIENIPNPVLNKTNTVMNKPHLLTNKRNFTANKPYLLTNKRNFTANKPYLLTNKRNLLANKSYPLTNKPHLGVKPCFIDNYYCFQEHHFYFFCRNHKKINQRSAIILHTQNAF